MCFFKKNNTKNMGFLKEEKNYNIYLPYFLNILIHNIHHKYLIIYTYKNNI